MDNKKDWHKSKSDENEHVTVHREDGSVASHEYRDGAKKFFPKKEDD